MASKVKRRLTTILCADVQSYSRLMEADEAATLATLTRYREAMTGLIERHDGRVVNTWGDAVLAEFASVVEAVQCAIELQRELADRNGELSSDRRMWFRIGINLGDVMVDGDDIYGEGVNVAARLQEVAEPGGIAISRAVYDQVRHKLTIGFDYLGDQKVKNIGDPIPSYRVVLDRRNAPAIDPHGSQPSDAPSAIGELSLPPERPPLRPDTSWSELVQLIRSLPRVLRFALGFAGFLFVINVLSGLHELWFIWPSAPILFITAWYVLAHGGAASPSDADKNR